MKIISMSKRDCELVRSLVPMEVAAYLRSMGWHEQPPPPWIRHGAVFSYRDGTEVLLPLSTELADFTRRMIEMVKTLEAVENRDVADILVDLSIVTDDVIRVRVADDDARDGSLSLTRAANVIAASCEMLLAAACAAVESKSYFPSHKPEVAEDYMRGVRMGQTQRGSFVVTLLSPLPRDWSSSSGFDDAPFERKVTQRLAQSLSAIDRCAKQAINESVLDPFEAAVEQGVSGNLCDALARMSEAGGDPCDLDIVLTWARTHPSSGEPVLRHRIGQNIVPVLREAAGLLKEVDCHSAAIRC